RPLAFLLPLVSLVLSPLACGGGGENGTGGHAGSSSTGSSGAGGAMEDPDDFAGAPPSCVYDCPQDACPAASAPDACPNRLPWNQIPHADTCDPWDGTFPAPAPGKCSATAPSGEAVKFAGVDPDDPTVLIMPGGRRLTPAGADVVFPDESAMTSNLIAVPGT